MKPNCLGCCFFRLVEIKGKQRRLCMLTGEKRPVAGMDRCTFIPGQWSQIDSILGLTNAAGASDTGIPNTVKPGSGFSRNGEIVAKTKFAIGDSIGFTPINHTAKAERGSLVRPGDGDTPVAHSARERTRLPFAF